MHNTIEKRQTKQHEFMLSFIQKAQKWQKYEQTRLSHTNEIIIEQREEEKEEKDINFDLHETGGGLGWGAFWRAHFRWLWSVSWSAGYSEFKLNFVKFSTFKWKIQLLRMSTFSF